MRKPCRRSRSRSSLLDRGAQLGGESAGWEYQLALDEALRRFELAARLNCPLVVCPPPLERPGIEGLESGYHDLLQIGRETGIEKMRQLLAE